MYQVIARKYRPQAFDHLIGQGHIKQTLSNALEQQRIAHGYIFSGQRGTGKTTVARIMARCLNCVEGPTMNPCGKCASCLEISAGNSVDVIEIDAASNRGINEMRELRESVRFRPARDRFKVFIIDEAHQITTDAFNALLKTLEEPPSWVVFMLCTTESHKLPATISSRCQHFSFRSVELDELVAHMQRICEQEGIQAEADALTVLAQSGGGSVRDSLSALDQAIACCGNTLNAEQLRFLMGAFSLDVLMRITDALENQNAQAMLQLVDDLERSGQNLQHFCRELSAFFRNLLVARVAGENRRLITATKLEIESLVSVAQRFSERDLTRYLNIALDLFAQLQHSLQPRFHVELGLLRLIEAGRIATVEQAINALRRLPEDGVATSLTESGSRASKDPASAEPSSGPQVPSRADGSSTSLPSAQQSSPGGPTALSSSRVVSPRMPDSSARVTRGSSASARSLAVRTESPSEELGKAELAPEKATPSAPVQPGSRPAGHRLSVLDGGRPRSSSAVEASQTEAQPTDSNSTGASPSDLASPASVSSGSHSDRSVEQETLEVAHADAGTPPAMTPDPAVFQQQLVDRLNEQGKRFTADAVERAELGFHVLSGGVTELRLLAPRETKLSLNENELRQALRGLAEPIPRIHLQFGDVASPAPAVRHSRDAGNAADDVELLQKVEADPAVQHVLAVFRGKITKVRSLRNNY